MPNMFDGAQDHHQFHPFVAPIARTTLPLHISFATPNNNTFLPFDPYNPSHQLPLQTNNLFHPLPHHSPKHDHQEKEEANTTFSSINVEIQRDQRQPPPPLIDSWTNDEVLALLRIRSSMENYFPQLTWEHVSRKLAEVGFKKSAEKCKEKFEDESRNFNYGKNNNYRFLSELEGLFQGDIDEQIPDPGDHEVVSVTTEKENSRDINNDIDAPPAVTKQCDKVVVMEKSKDKKRKRRDKFEVFKCYCESVVNKMMAQQEEIHNKLLKDMLKRDEEKLAREEVWKKQEMERMNKELDMMTQDQAIAGDRQAIIIEFLKKYLATSQDLGGANSNNKTKGSNRKCTTTSPLHSQNPNPSNGEINNNLEPTPSTNNVILDHQTTTCTSPPCQNPSSNDTTLLNVPSSSNSSPATYNNNNNHTNSLEGVGRRWPRDEVLALINLRCTSLNSEEKEGNNNKAPLWERISQGMSEMGYKRSAKRCKEKWENINKYFRKTKDVKKRSLDSRTCPYFHQLSSLYSQGKLVPQSERHGNHLNQTENSGEMSPDQPQAQSSPVGSGS